MRTVTRASLWEEMVVRSEALHDKAVLSQRRGSVSALAQIELLALDIAALARSARLFSSTEKGRS